MKWLVLAGGAHGHIPDEDVPAAEDTRGAAEADGAVQPHAALRGQHAHQ